MIVLRLLSTFFRVPAFVLDSCFWFQVLLFCCWWVRGFCWGSNCTSSSDRLPWLRMLLIFHARNEWGSTLPVPWLLLWMKKWHWLRYFFYRRSEINVGIRFLPSQSSGRRDTVLRSVRRGWALIWRRCWLCVWLYWWWWTRCPVWYTAYSCG